MSDLKPCPFLVRMCSMDGQIIGYTCKGECANCPAEDAKDKEIENLKAALEKIYHIGFGNAPDKVKIEFIKTAVHGAVHKNANAPDTNVGTMEG